jgi:hypothetical protein
MRDPRLPILTITSFCVGQKRHGVASVTVAVKTILSGRDLSGWRHDRTPLASQGGGGSTLGLREREASP